jgi:hypothetical protein
MPPYNTRKIAITSPTHIPKRKLSPYCLDVRELELFALGTFYEPKASSEEWLACATEKKDPHRRSHFGGPSFRWDIRLSDVVCECSLRGQGLLGSTVSRWPRYRDPF